MHPRNFFAELKRRNVYKVAVVYAVIAWLLIQGRIDFVFHIRIAGMGDESVRSGRAAGISDCIDSCLGLDPLPLRAKPQKTA